MSNRIKLLEPQLANQIAAGEVIERPASVVKELLENAIDAGATNIEIEIKKGGSDLIRITDNGQGMTKEDLPLALQRHGTSKIANIADLENIHSLGFRGEALASICSVARVVLSSCAAGQEQAWQIDAAGIMKDPILKPCAHPQGTTIIIQDLFYNTPARRKFLRSDKTEFMHIEEVIKRIALSHFNLKIKLVHNDRNALLLLPAKDQLSQEKRIASLFNKEFINHALKIDIEAQGLRLWGWLTQHDYALKTNQIQYFYVNGRTVRDKVIAHAVRQAYHEKIPAEHYPGFILFFELNPNAVDVNVHPTKYEVRFRETRLVHDFIYSSLDKALNSVEQEEKEQIEQKYKSVEKHNKPIQQHNQHVSQNHLSNSSKLSNNIYQKPEFKPQQIQQQIEKYQDLIKSPEQNQKPDEAKLFLGTAIACIGQQFIVSQTQDALIIINIKQANYYIILESYQKEFNQQQIKSQPLLLPLSINLDSARFKAIEKVLKLLTDLGFDISIVGEKTLMVRQAPVILRQVPTRELIFNIAASLEKNSINKAEELLEIIVNSSIELIPSPADILHMNRLLRQIEQLEISKAQEDKIWKKLSIDQLNAFFKA